jgi:predicted NACHT family NTPase
VALLGAIERQVTALADPGRDYEAEVKWLARYRRQVQARHGYLVPPDFDRRRRVAVADIYVPTDIDEDIDPERTVVTREEESSSLTVWDLADRLDRTVLLGDPGGGKTTAANVLADYFAADAGRRIPFLVTLRDYAAKEPPERSVVGHVESTLDTLYQCPVPDGLVERLLLTGRAVVIFDGLDELLDTSRRRDVAERVEQFCSAYPLTPVLVTSRLVGYDQARLDDAQFSCHRLGGFGDEEVADYARKWFLVQEGTAPAQAEADAQAFLAESTSAPDLRSNPLLLALMCILYRGAGSLPRDRAGIYAKCAELLLGKWDDQRRIHSELRAADFVEPAIRHLAWWLFGSQNPRAAVPERELVSKAAEFLQGRAFESEEEARAAAREFVEFCRGRMWVLSDVGTTAYGEKLYAFTHRTFLEYFAAAHLAAVSDAPENLARSLAPHVAVGEWDVVGDLAIAIKDRNSDRGADRIYATLLDLAPAEREPLLKFLAACLPSARPSPVTVRTLTRAVLDYAFGHSTLA